METKPSLYVIKIGGAILNDPEILSKFYETIHQLSCAKIIVHGGGNRASQLQEQLGYTPQLIEGRRVTDAETLDIVTMVYAGLLNKTLVAGLQAVGQRAIGLSGADANIIRAHKRKHSIIDYGFAGDIDHVNFKQLSGFLNSKLMPVLCAITHDGSGQLLNTNADTLAASIAKAMSGLYNTQLYYCFDKPGVLENVEDLDTVITHINTQKYKRLLDENRIADGMHPKLQTAFVALQGGVSQVHLGQLSMLTAIQQKHTTLCL